MAEPVLGSNFEVQVSATVDGSYVLIDGMNNFRRNKTRPTNKTGVFGRTQKVTSRGQREVTYSLSGVAIPGDAGQDMLRDADDSGDTVFIKVLYDDGKSYTQEVEVSGGEHAAPNTDDFQTTSFELIPIGDPTPAAGSVVL